MRDFNRIIKFKERHPVPQGEVFDITPVLIQGKSKNDLLVIVGQCRGVGSTEIVRGCTGMLIAKL